MAIELRLEAPISEVPAVSLNLALSGIPYATEEAEFVDIFWEYADVAADESVPPQFLITAAVESTFSVPFPQTSRPVRFYQRSRVNDGVEEPLNFDEMEQTIFTPPPTAESEGGGQTALFAFAAIDDPILSTTTRTTAWQVVIPAGTWTDKGDVVRFMFTGWTAFNGNNKNLYLKLGLDTILAVEDYVGSADNWRIEGEMILSGENQVTCSIEFFNGESTPREPVTYTVLPLNIAFGQNFKFEMSSDDPEDVAIGFGYGERIPKPPQVPSVDAEYLVDEYGSFLTDEADDYTETE